MHLLGQSRSCQTGSNVTPFKKSVRTMEQLYFCLLLFWITCPIVQQQNVSCSTYFCNHLQKDELKSRCSQLMDTLNNCMCYITQGLSPGQHEYYCQDITGTKFQIPTKRLEIVPLRNGTTSVVDADMGASAAGGAFPPAPGGAFPTAAGGAFPTAAGGVAFRPAGGAYRPDSGDVNEEVFYAYDETTKVQPMPSSLLISKQNTSSNEFTELLDRFLTYLPMTDITDFHFMAFCGYGLSSSCQNTDDSKLKMNAALNLSNTYQQNRVEKLVLTRNCVGEIDGNFSSLFPYVIELKLNQNKLEVIHSTTFQGLIKLETLDLSCNRLRIFYGFPIFYGLSSLKSLDLSLNRNMQFSGNELDPLVSLQYLNVSRTGLRSLPTNLFKKNMDLKILDLSHCFLNNTTVKGSGLESLTKLEHLSIAHNYFTTMTIDMLLRDASMQDSNLEQTHLPLTSRQLDHVDHLEMTGNCLSYNDSDSSLNHTVPIRHKNIDSLACQFCCLSADEAGMVAQKATSVIDLRENPVYEVNMDFLMNIAHLKKVHLSMSDKPNIFTTGYPSNSNNTTDDKSVHQKLKFNLKLAYPLYISQDVNGSDTQIFISDYSLSACDFLMIMRVNLNITTPSNHSINRSHMSFVFNNFTIADQRYQSWEDAKLDSTVLSTACNFTFYCPKECACTTIGFHEDIHVNCSHKHLVTFPNIEQFSTAVILHLSNNNIRKVQKEMVHDWSIIKELHLNHNLLESVENLTFVPHLRTLNLRNNKLKHFQTLRQMLHEVDNQTALMLSGNEWICDCETPEMKNVMHAKNIVDFEHITCSSIQSGRVLVLANATDIEFCPPNKSYKLLTLTVIPVLALVMVAITVGVIACYKYKQFLKLWLFTHGFCLRFVTEDDIDADKIYDAFISYSTKDESWVANVLVSVLEKEPPFYKLCLHDRDWPVGEWIIEQIFLSVKQSRRTIIVLTENFLNSSWSRMEFLAAYNQAVADQVNRVLVVVPGGVPDIKQMDSELKTFIALNTYIKWEEPYFWRKLRCAMPRVKQTSKSQEQHTTNV